MKLTDKFVFFWGAEDVFSNFHYFPFEHQGASFKWSEQAVMYRKAKLFGAHKIASKILEANSPKECKALGRSRQIPFNEEVWLKNRERIYKEVLKDKFSHPHAKIAILLTGNRMLVEASPYDKIWGIGLSESNPDAENPEKWKGLNLLGRVLMEVRSELRQ
ncbi:NADAR family protein [Bacillus haynesii]|uniref:NADAR family protein n=1 Tax=Bacillus haynesii TaxID=1925021 RepID=UPI00228175CD|nr:NADAR family protein [Bacillus haynesii]MCY8549413.1 NADAR family protein [Bacillus haynesii]